MRTTIASTSSSNSTSSQWSRHRATCRSAQSSGASAMGQMLAGASVANSSLANYYRRVPLPASLRHRDFRLLVAGTATSSLGNAITPVALAFAVLDLGGSASDLGIVVALFALADVVTVLFGGVLGDRVSRKLMMEGSAAACAVTQGLLATLLIGGWATISVVAAFGMVTGCLGALSNPSSPAMTRLVVPPP